MKINVLIADNQTLTAEGIISLLSADKKIKVIGKAGTKDELEQIIIDHKPGVLVIDHNYDSHFTTDIIKSISSRFGFTNILILSDKQDRDEILDLADNGIKNYISKKCSAKEIIDAIYATAKGELFRCEKTLETVYGSNAVLSKESTLYLLSIRETEIVHLISEGLTNKDIAEKLFLSIHTIKTHRKNIIKKLGFTFKNAAELISFTGGKAYLD